MCSIHLTNITMATNICNVLYHKFYIASLMLQIFLLNLVNPWFCSSDMNDV